MATAMTFWPPVYSYTLLRHSQEEEEEKMVPPIWEKGREGTYGVIVREKRGRRRRGPKDEMKWEEEEGRGKGNAICRKGDNLQKYGISSWAHSGGQRKRIKKSIRKTYFLVWEIWQLIQKYISAP